MTAHTVSFEAAFPLNHVLLSLLASSQFAHSLPAPHFLVLVSESQGKDPFMEFSTFFGFYLARPAFFIPIDSNPPVFIT